MCVVLPLGCASASITDHGSGGADPPGGRCNARPQSFSGLGQQHVAECSPLTYPENPPAGGDHYSVWAAFQSYTFPLPRGYWVHDLEHGAVVYSYNCPQGCTDEVNEVEAMINALPKDPLCGSRAPRRVLLTPDPELDVRWGLSAWGHTVRADCFDLERFRLFYLNHFGLGPEQLCAPGFDFPDMSACP